MKIKRILTGIVLVGALAFGGTGCDTNSNENHTSVNESTTQSQPQYQTRNISGKIIGIDEDSFPIWIKDGSAGGGANFQYELIRVQDGERNVKQLLSPMPTGYQIDDDVTFNYMERQSITFSELLNQYGTNPRSEVLQKSEPLQKGNVRMDGLLK